MSHFKSAPFPQKSLLSISISAALYFSLINTSSAGIIKQQVTMQTAGQSMWNTGSSAVIDESVFLGIEWDESGKIFEIGTASAGSNGIKATGKSSGKVGLDLGVKFDSGTVNSSLPFEFSFDLPDASDLNDGEAFSMGIVSSTLLGGAFLETISPTFQAYADLIVKADASVTVKGCYDLWVDSDCGSKTKKLLDIDKSFELLSINQGKDGEIRVLDGFSDLFAAGSTAASLVKVSSETDPNDPNGKKKEKVSIDLTPKVGFGSSPLVEVDVRLPDIITKEYLAASGLSVSGSGSNNVLSSSGSDSFLSLDIDVDQIGTAIGILPPLGVEADVDFGVGSVSASIDLVDLTLTPEVSLTQDFSLSIKDIGVSYVFDEAVMAGLTEDSMSMVSGLNVSDLNDDIFVTWTDGQDLGITPIYDITVELTNQTGLTVSADFTVDLLKGTMSGEVFGIDLGSSSLDPLYQKTYDLGDLGALNLFDDTFELAGFDAEDGNKFLFSSDNLNFTDGWAFWSDETSWDGDIPLINDVTIGDGSLAIVFSDAQSGSMSLNGSGTVYVGTNILGDTGVLAVGGDFISLESDRNRIIVAGDGQLKLADDMDITGDGYIELNDDATLTSVGSEMANVRLDGVNIDSRDANSTISNLALTLKNGSAITATNGQLDINNASITGDGKSILSTSSNGYMAFNSVDLEGVNLNGDFYVGDKDNTECVWDSQQAGCILYQNKNTVQWNAGASGVMSLDGSIEVFSQTSSNQPANIKTLVLDGLEEGNTLINNGQISLITSNSGSFDNSFGLQSQSVMSVKQDFTFAGNGSVLLLGEENDLGDGARIGGAAGANLVNGADHTIQGNGAIYGFASVDNQGTITAHDGELKVSTGALVNNGELKAENNGTLSISSAWTNNGKVEAIGTGTVLSNDVIGSGATRLSNLTTSTDAITLTGGQWEASNGGTISLGTEASSSNFTTFKNSADITLDGATSSMVVGKSLDQYSVFNNQHDGALTLNNGATFNTSSFQNNGTVNLANGTLKGLENNAGGLVQGYGQIVLSSALGANSNEYVNNGTIRAQDGWLRLNTASSSGNFVNKGTVEVMGGARLSTGVYASDTFDGNGGTWAAYADDQAATIGFLQNHTSSNDNPPGISTLTNGTVILSGEKANLNTTVFFIPDPGGITSVQDIDLQDSLEKISSTATLALENGQHFAANGLLTNQGQIRLDDAKLSSVFVVNEGKIVGNGDLNTHVVNTGVVTASGGQLNLGSVISNSDSFETGTIEVANTYGDVLHLNNTHVIGGNLNVAENGQVNGSGDIDGVLVANQGKIVSDSTGLNIDFASGSSNTGTILSTNGSSISLQGQSLQNYGGLIRVDQGSSIDLKGITVIQGAVEVVGNGSVLSGYGTLDNIELQVSGGTITANVDGKRLTIDPGETAQLLRATLQAENGGILLLTSGDFDNGGGTLIEAKDGSVVEIKNITMDGGRLVSSGTGKIIDLGSSSFKDMTIDANTEVADGGEFKLEGTIINSASLTALNGGEIIMDNARVTSLSIEKVTNPDGSVSFVPVYLDGTLNIDAGGTLKGGGLVEELAMENKGTIHAEGSNALIFDLKGDLFVNNGEIDVTGAGGMELRDNEVVNNGMVNVESSLTVKNEFTQKGGELNVDGQLIASTVTIDKGSIGGNGVVNSDVVVNEQGRISRGSLVMMEDLYLYGTLEVDMTDSNMFDVLDVKGDVTFSETTQMEFIFDSMFNPIDGFSFDFLLADNFINFDLLGINNFNVKGLLDGIDWDVMFDDFSDGFSVVFSNNRPQSDIPEPKLIMLFIFALAFLVLRRKEPAPKRLH